jgi:hypothetical protein
MMAVATFFCFFLALVPILICACWACCIFCDGKGVRRANSSAEQDGFHPLFSPAEGL